MQRYAILLSAITLLLTTPVLAQQSLLRDFSEEQCRRHLTNARRLHATGAVTEALMVFEEGTNECEDHAPLLADYGWVLVRSGQPAEGVRILERAYMAASAPRQRAAILHSLGVAQENLGAHRSAMNAYLGSLHLRSSAATSARARSLSHRHHRTHPDAPPLGSEGLVQVVAPQGAWQELAPCDFHDGADAARYMGERRGCESAHRWREGDVTFERVRVGDSVEAFDELWAQRANQWIRLRTDEVWQGAFGGEFTNLDYENVRTVRRGEDSWLYVDAHFMTVDYDYSEAYREDHFVHWACRVGEASECVEINRGDEFFAGPGRCFHWGECSADDTLVQADERTLPVEQRDAHADAVVRWQGDRVRLVGRAVPPGLSGWRSIDAFRDDSLHEREHVSLFAVDEQRSTVKLSESVDGDITRFIDPARVRAAAGRRRTALDPVPTRVQR